MKRGDIITPFKVGLLVIVGVAAAIFMGLFLQGRSSPQNTITVHGAFRDATGLAVKSRVMVAGIPVGSIRRISLEGGRAKVEVSIDRSILLLSGVTDETSAARNGASMTKKQASFIGDYFVELTPGTEGEPLVDGAEIPHVIEPAGLDEMMTKLNAITDDISLVTRSLASVFGGEEGQETLKKLLGNLEVILERLNGFVGTNSVKLDRILDNVEVITSDVRGLTRTSGESIATILRDAESIVQEVRFIVGQSSNDLQSGLGTLKGTLSQLESTLDSLNYSLQNVQDITDKINEGHGTIGELVNNPRIARRTEQILDDTGEFIDRVSRLKTLVELRSEYHLRARELKNVLGVRFQPNDRKYYLLELIDDFRGRTDIVRETINTTNAGQSDGLYNETTVTTTDDFKVSVEYGHRFDISPWLGITGRFGLIESSGGVGANLHLGPRRWLNVQTDLFDFGQEAQPRLRTSTSLGVFTYAYLTGGIDDLLNPTRRQYFFGAGIRFDDEDLKALLTTTGIPTGSP